MWGNRQKKILCLPYNLISIKKPFEIKYTFQKFWKFLCLSDFTVTLIHPRSSKHSCQHFIDKWMCHFRAKKQCFLVISQNVFYFVSSLLSTPIKTFQDTVCKNIFKDTLTKYFSSFFIKNLKAKTLFFYFLKSIQDFFDLFLRHLRRHWRTFFI